MGPGLTAVLAAQLLLAAPVVDLGKVGSVSLPVQCLPSSQAGFDRALALLHSFFYEEARLAFEEVKAQDPRCAMAEWGVAMTYYHPIWAPPLPDERARGTAASARAAALGSKSPLAQGLIGAMEAYWKTGAVGGGGTVGVPSCHGGAPSPGGGAQAFRSSLAALWKQFPGNVEVGSFYALSLLGTAPKTDRTLAQQREAAQLLETLWAKHPDHPGVVHYLIHADDYPETAQRGLAAARAYAGLAPQVPHALHMPSHIFVRLGLWDDDVTSNLSALAAAKRWMALRHPGASFSDDLHAGDYLLYGYLQKGQDELADAEIARIGAVREVYPAHELAAAVARALVPMRGVLERERWADAAKLEVAPITAFESYPFVRGLVSYSHGLGAARAGRLEEAHAAADELGKLSTSLDGAGPLGYWKGLLRAYEQATRAWIAHAEGKGDAAVELMRASAKLEDSLGPHPVMPGPLLPAREQLGELLLLTGSPREALAEYRTSLQLYPGRLRSLHGAMQSALDVKDGGAAKGYARELAQQLRGSKRPMRAQALKVLGE